MSSLGRPLFLVLAVISSSGCASHRYLDETSLGDLSSTATIIKPKEDSIGFFYRITTFTTVDGESTGYALRKQKIVVPAGKREIGALYKAKNKAFHAREATAFLTFEAQAGHEYEVASKEDLRTVTFWIEDVAAGERVSDTLVVPVTEYSDADFSIR
jgi:hypothetical protein